MRTILILALCLIARTGFAQSIKVEPFEALVAKSVRTIELPEGVAVILEESQGVKTGAYLKVTSDRKWATPVYDGINIGETKTPGEWIMFAPPGKYRVLLAETDSELRPRYTWHDVVINGAQPPTDPPTGDFSALTKASKEAADKLNDPKTRAALAAAYKTALTAAAGKPYANAQSIVTMARRTALQANMRGSDANWNSWLKQIDAELTKIVPAGDAEKYLQAISAIVKGLE